MPASTHVNSSRMRQISDNERQRLLDRCRELDFACSILNLFGTIASLDYRKILNDSEWALNSLNFQRLLLIVYAWAYIGFVKLASTAVFAKYRSTVIIFYCLSLAAMPLIRDSSGILTRLDVEPSNIAFLQWIIDPIKILMGGKFLQLFMYPSFLPLSPLKSFMFQQLFLIAGSRNQLALCSSRLLSSSVYTPRIDFVYSVLGVLCTPVTFFTDLEVHDAAHIQCRAVATFFQIVFGILMPLIYLVKVAPPSVQLALAGSPSERRVLNILAQFVSPSESLKDFLHDGEAETRDDALDNLWELHARLATSWYLLVLIWTVSNVVL